MLTLKEAELAFADGRMNEDDFDAYRCAWYRSAARFGDYDYAHPECRNSKEWRPLDMEPRP